MTKTTPKMEVHPLADLFPMMTDAELADLAADIKENGLIHPIITDATGKVLIDGRNRLRACEIAGVEPRFETTASDPAAFIVSANLNRRNLSKGQQAIALAFIYPDEGERGRGKKSDVIKCAEAADFSRRRLEQARSILRHSRSLAEQVIAGNEKFEKALETVQLEKAAAQSLENRHKTLREKAPDLADRVADEAITVDEGLSLLRERERQDALLRDKAKDTAAELDTIPGMVQTIMIGVEKGQVIKLEPALMESLERSIAELRQFVRA